MDELRRSGKSPTDMANQVNELTHLKYERAHLAYLHAVQNVREAEAGAYGQRTIGQYLLQGTLGQVFRSDHTRKMARKVTLASGAMSSLAVMNENWLIVSWVMVQAETERSLHPMFQGMAQSDPELSEGIMDRDGGTLQLNHVAGEGAKVPVWIPVRGTSQQEGYHFHQAQWVTGPQVSPELFQAQAMTGVVRWNFQRPVDMKKPGAVLPAVFDPASMWELNSASMAVTGQDKCPAFTSLTETLEKDVSGALPLPLKSSPRSARTGPMKTGGGVFVLDHTHWTLPMKDAIDSLLQYHHGDKDILRLVDRDYADTVHRSAADPNSLLRPTTRFHISRYVKHLAKLLNTSSSLNTSPEKLLETQQLWIPLNPNPFSGFAGLFTNNDPVTSLDDFLRRALRKSLKSENGHLDLFVRFLHGLSLESNQRILGGLLDQIENHPETIQKVLNNLKEENSDGISPDRSINIFHCLMEMKDQSVHQEIQEFLKSGEISERRLSEIHCSALAGFSS
ncbi:hypothetical protein D4764_0131940 [Takifugu flavidus]|uniref:NACHT LRR and PYD domain-containing protein n=1 Tax=Takifugu flavidus TaxID=433684 RepID=A0A5C6MEK4_9TELE|nr:hypothetical protein D4764_0131940 [Takifugu flavidus]